MSANFKTVCNGGRGESALLRARCHYPPAAALLDLSVAVFMLDGTRSDGSMVLMGGVAMVFTTLLPRLSSHALSYAVHAAAGLVALSLGAEVDQKQGRLTNFAVILAITIAVAYKSERNRRENHLLAWRLRRSRAGEKEAGACRDGAPRRGVHLFLRLFWGWVTQLFVWLAVALQFLLLLVYRRMRIACIGRGARRARGGGGGCEGQGRRGCPERLSAGRRVYLSRGTCALPHPHWLCLCGIV